MLTYLVLVLISLASANRHEYHPSAKSRSYKTSRFNCPTSDPSMYKHTGKSVPNPGRPASRQAILMTWMDLTRQGKAKRPKKRRERTCELAGRAGNGFASADRLRGKKPRQGPVCFVMGAAEAFPRCRFLTETWHLGGETRCRKNGQSR